MRAVEKTLLLRLMACLNRMANLYPFNPCDIRRVADGCRTASEASAKLYTAVSCIGFRDYDDAASYMGDAEEILGIAKE